jgi:hypothetical protein
VGNLIDKFLRSMQILLRQADPNWNRCGRM